MSVTIAIFVHDEIALLKRTLRSLRRNTKYPYQLLIINDAGSKKTRDYLYRLNNITLIRNTSRMGYAHCANIAIDHSDTPHILLLDSAAYVTEGWLTLLIDRLKENPAHGIAGPSTCLAWGDQSIQADPDWGVSKIESFAQELHQKQGNRFRCLDELHNVSGFCYCFKRELLEHIGYFDEAYGLGQCEDIDYNTRAAQAGYKALWVCGAYVHRFPLQRFGPGTGTLLERNKKLYQDKFCLLQIENRRSQYCTHCLGEKSEFFTKTINPKQVLRMPRQFTIISKSGNTTKIPMAPRQSAMDSAMTNTKDIGDLSHLQLVADSNYVNTGGGGSGDPIQLTADSKNGNTTEAGPVVQPQFRTDSKPPDTKDAGIFVSCIMPTYNRRSFVPKTIEYFLRQDYPNRELIIVDDGTDAIEDLVPQDPRIRYLGLTKKHTIGAKRNLAITNARGQIIIHWDDDDWMATHRIRYQVQTLLKEGADICGLDTLFFFEPSAQKAWQYIYPGSEKPWLAGGTFCYTKNAWKKDPFPDINEGEDTRFVWGDSFNKIVALQDNTFYAALIHKGNTSEKCTNDIRWHSLPIKRIRSLMGKDFRFYRSLLPLDTNTGRPAKEEPAALTPLKGEIPVYSILMVVHNALEIVKMSVMRTLRYLPDDARLIVVDNASNDGTRQFLELCASKESIQLIRVERNIGHGPGLELARRDIRSPYIVTLDSDAFPLCANWLSQLRHRLNAQTKVAGILHHRDYIHPSCLMIARSTLEDFDLSFPDEKNRPSQLDVAERISVEIKGRGFKIAGLQKTAGRRRGSISEPVYLGSSYEGIVYHQWYTTRAFLTGGQKVDDVPTEAIEDSMQEVLEEYHNEFREITVVLGIRATASQPRRLANALAALRALHLQTLERLRYRVVVVEQDRSPNLKESLLPFCDRYIFAHNPGPYNRSWGFNIGAVRSMGKTGAFCFVDADLLVPPDFLSCCLHEIKSGARAVLPYNEVLYLDAASTLKAVRDRLRTRPFNPHDYKGDIFSLSVGGVVWVEPALYFDIGGHNEDFRGWGWEDREFLNRLTQKTTIKRLPRRLLHLYHSPTAMLEANATDNEILYETLLKEPPASAKTAIGNPNRYTPEPPMRDIKQNIQGKRDWENWYKWSDERIKDIVQDERQRKQGHSLRARIFQTVVQLAVPPRWEEAPPRGEEAPLHGEEAPPHGEGPPSHGEGARVLEVGCGPGAFRHYLRRYQGALQPGRESITWIGMDITYKMLKTTREFFPEALLCNADAGALPFADNSFDVVFINHVLEHLPPWLMECTLKEALRTASKNVVLGFFIPPVHSGSHKVNRVGENFIDTQWTARELETIIRENHWILHEQLDIRAGDGENNTLWTLMPADVENKSKVKISIVMPTYKRSHSIFRTVDLIRRQSFTDWELIVVDNDGCTRYDFDDPRIRVYCHNSRSSASYARNKGLQYATGELVCFFDDDDDMFPDYLERFAHAFRQNPNAKMVRCGMIVTGGKTNYSYATPECWLRRQFATPTWRDDGLEQDQNYFCRLIRQNRWEEEKGDIVVIQKALCRANADPRGGLRIGNY